MKKHSLFEIAERKKNKNTFPLFVDRILTENSKNT